MNKRHTENSGKKLWAVLILSALVFYAVFLSDIIYKKATTKKEEVSLPKGRLVIWDTPLTTVTGSKFAFIDTITDEFCESRRGVSAYFYKISERSPEETIAKNIENSNRPDIIRSEIKGYSAPRDNLLKNADTAAKLSSRYLGFMKNDYGDNIILDICYDISAILINTTLTDSLGVSVPDNINTKEGFLAFLGELEAADVKGEYDTLALDRADVYSYLPFLFGAASDSLHDEYLASVAEYVSASQTPRADFYGGKTVVLCGDLDDAAYITRRQLAGKGFDFALINYPSDGQEFVFIKDILSYVFFDSNDSEKNSLLCDFAEYFLSDAALKYTENLGKLCTADCEIAYERYPYLKPFSSEALSRYCYKDEYIQKLSLEYNNYF